MSSRKKPEKFLRNIIILIICVAFISEGVWAALSYSQATTITYLPAQVNIYKASDKEDILREVEELKKVRSSQTSVIIVGDMMLSRTVNEKMRAYDDYYYPFQKLGDFLSKADVTFGNLESPIYSGRSVPSRSFIFDAHPKVAKSLASAGFDIVSMANNHAGNAGSDGFLKTFEELNENGIKYVGAAKNSYDLSQQGMITETNGIKIGWLAYSYGPSYYQAGPDYAGMALMNIDQMQNDVERLKLQVDHVFVSMHSGNEYTENLTNQQTEFAHSAIDTGASLVIGHHPHVVQRFEEYHGGYIFYSLGNFIFDQMWSQDTRRGLAVKFYLDKENLNSFEFYPTRIHDFAQPHFSAGYDQQNIWDRLRTDKGLGLAAYVQDNEIRITLTAQQVFNPKEPENEIFLESDINENGITEYIYLRDNTVFIIENNQIQWQSYADWKVRKIFLSDANDDGKIDLNMIMDKADGCHWFIYGWRRGSWQPYWDSSHIYPSILDIEEVEPGLYLVLETKEGQESLTLWQWDEWVFKLIDQIENVYISELEDVGSGLYLLK